MARLAAMEKAQYYPTPARVARLIGETIARAWTPDGGTLLDNCAGTGAALVEIAGALSAAHKARTGRRADWQTYGIELDAERAAEAARLLSRCMHAPAEQVHVDGQADIAFCNPPYDSAQDGTRAELPFIAQAAAAARRLLVLVLVREFAAGGKYAGMLADVLRRTGMHIVHAADFPAPESEAFDQIVIFCTPGYYHSPAAPACVIGDGDIVLPYYAGTDPRKPLQLVDKGAPADTGVSILDGHAHAGAVALIGAPDQDDALAPLEPMRTEHAALIAAAGMLNGLEIDGDVWKGAVSKTTKTTTRPVLDYATGSCYTETRTAELHRITLTAFDTRTGELRSVTNTEQPEQFADVLRANAGRFVDAARAAYRARFTAADTAGVDLSRIRAPKRIPGRPDGLLAKQAECAAAIVRYWQTAGKVATIVGEMSTGKTLTSIAAAAAYSQAAGGRLKTVCMIPARADLQRKWIAEARAVLRDIPGAWSEPAETIAQFDALMQRPGPGVIVMRETSAKACSSWRNLSPDQLPGRRIRERTADGADALVRIPLCPTCSEPVDVDKLTKRTKDGRHVRKYICEHCRTALWTFAAGGAAPRYPLARHLRNHYRGRYIAIMDEAHNYKGGDTNRGYAAQDVITGAHRAVQMTGTIFSGLASSIFYLLYRSDPAFRRLYSFRDVQTFVDAYGLRETVSRSYKDRTGGNRASGYRTVGEKAAERPGIHPRMAALLLNSAAFMQLRDFDHSMPEYSEHTLFTDPDPELANRVGRYIDDLKDTAVQAKLAGEGASMLAQWQHARFGVYDRPDQPENIGGNHYQPPDCSRPFSKEQALLRLVSREKSRGRKVLCFVGQITRRDPTTRLLRLLEDRGMRGAVLRDNVKRRLDFIRHELAEGADIIFTSAQLVSEGIDITECPTIVWYAHHFDTYVMPQANRRAYRLNQTEPVEIYYLAYNETPQAAAMARIAAKLKAQSQLQGDVAQGLARLQAEDDMIDNLHDLTSDREHHESSMSLEDLPPMPDTIADIIAGAETAAAAADRQPAAAAPRFYQFTPAAGKAEQLALF